MTRAEIYFMDVARAMVETGDWLVPRYQGSPFFDKPPLTYWLMAAVFHLLGFTRAAARLVSVSATVGLLLTTAGLGRRLLGRRAALLGTIALGTTLLVLSVGRLAMSDMLLALWCTLAVAVGVRASQERATVPRMAALGALVGLGFLTKGPIAVVLAGSGLAVLAVRGHDGRRLRPGVATAAAGIACFAAFGLWWFAALAWHLGAGPLVYFFRQENLERFAGERYDEGLSPLFYVGAYLGAGLPWSLLLPIAAWRAWRRGAVLVLWFVLMAIPLGAARGKMDYYLLPLLPAASLVVGHHLASRWNAVDRAWARVALVIFAALLALVPAALEGRIPTEWLPSWPARAALVALGVAVALAAAFAAARPSPLRFVVVASIGMALTFTVFAGAFVPAFNAAQPNAEVVADVQRERAWRPDAELAACGDPALVARDLLFEARVIVHDRCDLWSLASSHLPFLLLVSAEAEQALEAEPGIREVARYRCVPVGSFNSARSTSDRRILKEKGVAESTAPRYHRPPCGVWRWRSWGRSWSCPARLRIPRRSATST
jgi:4-amino-4-deoxy-L-arabinose transferase-like glycosyltransferase